MASSLPWASRILPRSGSMERMVLDGVRAETILWSGWKKSWIQAMRTIRATDAMSMST